MASGVGPLVRAWRSARGLSQEHLAARAGVSTRHLSFIETGRARPGREVVLALAGALAVLTMGSIGILAYLIRRRWTAAHAAVA